MVRRRIASEAMRRAMERWAATRPRGSVALAIAVHADDGAERVPPDVVEQLTTIWYSRPYRWRQELATEAGPAVVVTDGVRQWSSWPGGNAHTNEDAPEEHPVGPELPEWELFHAGALTRDLRIVGTRVTERDGLTVEALEAAPSDDGDRPWPPGLSPAADRFTLVVDRERDLVLRLAAWSGDDECLTVELVDVAFGVSHPDDLFRVTLPPGVRFQPLPTPPHGRARRRSQDRAPLRWLRRRGRR